MGSATRACVTDACVTDHKQIETRARLNASVNVAFVNYLKSLPADDVEKVIHETAAKVTKEIDCTACGKCCSALVIAPKYGDISRLAKHVNQSTGEFKRRYMRIDHEGDLIFKKRPCPFLKNLRCTAYESRPDLCRKYPYLDQPGVSRDLARMLRNVEVCPIVFNTFERLKSEYARRGAKRALGNVNL